MRVFIVLDDIEQTYQLEALAADICWFGPGTRIIVTTRCRDTLRAPVFAMFPNLERLILEGCEKLAVVHALIMHLKALSFLSLKGCLSITKLPHQLGSLKALTELILEGTLMKEIPILDSMKKLEILRMKDCNLLSYVPISIGHLTSLMGLVLDYSGIFELPDS